MLRNIWTICGRKIVLWRRGRTVRKWTHLLIHYRWLLRIWNLMRRQIRSAHVLSKINSLKFTLARVRRELKWSHRRADSSKCSRTSTTPKSRNKSSSTKLGTRRSRLSEQINWWIWLVQSDKKINHKLSGVTNLHLALAWVLAISSLIHEHWRKSYKRVAKSVPSKSQAQICKPLTRQWWAQWPLTLVYFSKDKQ